jgi:hypothetical protein
MTEYKREDPRHATGALVEIVEIFPGEHYDQAKVDEVPVIKAHRVYVNGTPVGLITRDDGIVLSVDPREEDATILTLKLMPRQVLVRGVVETADDADDTGEEVDLLAKFQPVDLTDVEFRPIDESAAFIPADAPEATDAEWHPVDAAVAEEDKTL